MVYKDAIFILDSRQQTLLRFDSKGKFVSKIHKIGKGPGEYVRLSDFCINKEQDQVILLTNDKKLMFYSFDGEYVKQINLKDLVCHYLTYLEDGRVLLYSETSEYRFYFYDFKKGKVIRKNLANNDFTIKTGFGHLYSPFSQKNNESYYFTDMYSYDIFNISADKITCKTLNFDKYIYDLKKLSINRGQNAYKEQYKKLLLAGEYAMNIFYFFETTDYYITSYFFNKKVQTSILDKRHKRNYLFDHYEFPHVNYYSNDILYGIFEPLSLKKYLPKNLLFEIENININDNPIIIIYKFKKDV